MKKFGDDVTMSGVPLHYNDPIDEKEDPDIRLRQEALSKIIASVQLHQKNNIFGNDRLNNCRLENNMRRAFSFRHLPVIQEEDDESSDDEKPNGFFCYKPKRKRRFSIGTDKDLTQYADKNFFEAIDDIRNGKYLPNNVYADSHPPREFTQDDRMFHHERATQTDDDDLKLLWRLARTIPPFTLADILGEFEMDPSGMYIIVRDGGKLKDKHGRLVNSRGYLVDDESNVVHQNGTKIFNYDELDENGEIPAPFAIDESDYDLLAKPNLLPKISSKSKPPRPKNKKSDKKSSKNNKSSITNNSKRERPLSDKSDISDVKSNRISNKNKMRPITSDTYRPRTTKRFMKQTAPLNNNFIHNKEAEITHDPTDFESIVDLEKVYLSQNEKTLSKPNMKMNRSEVGDPTRENLNGGILDDILLNQRPVYYGDTSDLLSRSRKLQY